MLFSHLQLYSVLVLTLFALSDYVIWTMSKKREGLLLGKSQEGEGVTGLFKGVHPPHPLHSSEITASTVLTVLVFCKMVLHMLSFLKKIVLPPYDSTRG